MRELELGAVAQKAGLYRWEDLDPRIQRAIRGGSPFAGGQDETARYDASGNEVGMALQDLEGNMFLHPVGGGAPVPIDEKGIDFSAMGQSAGVEYSLASLRGRSVFATHAGTLGEGVLVDTSFIPAEAIPSNAIPAEFKHGDAIPAELLPPDMAIPSNALAIPSNLVDPKTEIDSRALPAELIPAGYQRGDAIPAEAIPSNAIPAEAIPAEAIPSNAIPAEIVSQLALPAAAIPSNAIPAEAIPSNAIPAEAIPAEAIPSNAIPAEAIPAEALARQELEELRRNRRNR